MSRQPAGWFCSAGLPPHAAVAVFGKPSRRIRPSSSYTMQPHIVNNVVQYGIYDSLERLLFTCKVGRLLLQGLAAAAPGRGGSRTGPWAGRRVRHADSHSRQCSEKMQTRARPHAASSQRSHGLQYQPAKRPHLPLPALQSSGRVWYQVHTRTRVGRRGNILHVAYTAKKIAV